MENSNLDINRNLSVETIYSMLINHDAIIRQDAKDYCIGKDIPVEIIERWIGSDSSDLKIAAMNASRGRNDVPIGLINMGLEDDEAVAWAAADACKGRIIPHYYFEYWIGMPYSPMRNAAYNSCGPMDA